MNEIDIKWDKKKTKIKFPKPVNTWELFLTLQKVEEHILHQMIKDLEKENKKKNEN